MRQFIERHMNPILLAGGALGLGWPYWDWAPDWAPAALIMFATYLACFRLSVRDLGLVNWRNAAPFFVLRFVVLPVLLYLLARETMPQFAVGILLVAVLPVGVSCPAVVSVLGGNVSLAIILTFISTVLAPFLLPLIFEWQSGGQLQVNTGEMFKTLLLILLMPVVLYRYTRRYKPLRHMALTYGKSITIVEISLMIAIVVGKQRELILGEPLLLAESFLLSLILFAACLYAGWLWAKNQGKEQRIAYAATAGLNNAGLGIGLAVLYFPPVVVIFTVGAELAWALVPAMVRTLIKQHPKK